MIFKSLDRILCLFVQIFLFLLIGNMKLINSLIFFLKQLQVRSILVMWLKCRFLDTEVDGSNPGIGMLYP